jgi:hypothetical protein
MMNENAQFTIMDVLNILSFIIGIKNLDANLSQDTAGDLLSAAVNEIHDHLAEQDRKINIIMEKLGVDYNDENQKIS